MPLAFAQPVHAPRGPAGRLSAPRLLALTACLVAGMADAPASAQGRPRAVEVGAPDIPAQAQGAEPSVRVLPDPAAAPARVDRAAPVAHEGVGVLIDRAKVIRLPDRTQTVIVGNPLIADVTLQRGGIAVLTGKSYGVTNLIALDPSGAMLAESLVSVQAPTEAMVTVQRGLERETYSCNPHCQRSLLLGDSNAYFTEVGAQAERRNALATQR